MSVYDDRRRLSANEAEPIGPVIDVRGTSEAMGRLLPVWHLVPSDMLAHEVRR